MTDIIEKLRDYAEYGMSEPDDAALFLEAADEIEKLRAALKPLANAKSANTYGGDTGLYFIDPADRRIAAAALNNIKSDNK